MKKDTPTFIVPFLAISTKAKELIQNDEGVRIDVFLTISKPTWRGNLMSYIMERY